MAKDIFIFNLIPPRSREEIEETKERNSSIVYALTLVLASAFVIFILNVVRITLIEPAKIQIEDDIASIQAQTGEGSQAVLLNGELFLKAQLLEEILVEDIAVERIINVSNQVAGGNEILSYRRDGTGRIELLIRVDSIQSAANVISQAYLNSQVEDPLLSRINPDTGSDEMVITINFSIIEATV